MSETTVFTAQRRRLVLNGFMDLLYLAQKHNVPINPKLAERIRAGWDAVKLPEMQSMSFHPAGASTKSPLILPFTETTSMRSFSEVEQYAAAADMKQWAKRG
jgi:hypothetical protein